MPLKHHLLMVLDPAPLMMAGLFALVMAFAHTAGLYGIPAGVIITSWFFKYCFALFDAVVAGDHEPPVLSYEIINPLTGRHLLVRAAVIPLGAVLPLVLPGRGVLTMLALYFGAQMILMAAFAAAGALVFAHRLELGIETLTPQERRASRDQRDFATERGRMLDRAYAALRLKRRQDAWGEIQRWLDAHGSGGRALGEYHALLGATSAWDDPSVADRVASGYLDHLLAAGENGLAVDVLTERLARHPGFRPATPATTVRLRELARFAGRAALARQLQTSAPAPGPAPPGETR